MVEANAKPSCRLSSSAAPNVFLSSSWQAGWRLVPLDFGSALVYDKTEQPVAWYPERFLSRVPSARTWVCSAGSYVRLYSLEGSGLPVETVEQRSATGTSQNETHEVVTTFKIAYVFDISQTNGKALPEFARAQGDPGACLGRLEGFVADRGIKLERRESLRMAEGVSIGGTILLKASLAPAEEFSVLVHETAHEILHQDPASRSKERTVREAEAEAVAFVVCQGIGLDVNTASSDYIQLYDGDKKTLMQSLERIQRTAAEILEAVTREAEEPSTKTGGHAGIAMAA